MADEPEGLTHLDTHGRASMVDVGNKPDLLRTAVASGFVALQPRTVDLVRRDGLSKGDVLSVARVAGIQAAKQTQQLIPLCHQIPLTKVSVDFHVEDGGIRIEAMAKTVAKTGVEMEALTAVTVAALTIYDMCKAVDQSMRVEDVQLVKQVCSWAHVAFK